MRSILDRFTRPSAGFVPQTRQDVFALRLAQKLDDRPAAAHYAVLASEYSEAQLLNAYWRTLRYAPSGERGRRFHVELARVPANGSSNGDTSLIAIRVERRAVAAAILRRDYLEYTDARQLSSAHDKALASAVGFINWMLARFPAESAAIESIPNAHECQRRVLHNAICQTLRDRLLPIWEIPKAALLDGYGHPALRSRRQVREVATSIWPILAGTHAKLFIQDAAVLGLHVQTERLFMINPNSA